MKSLWGRVNVRRGSGIFDVQKVWVAVAEEFNTYQSGSRSSVHSHIHKAFPDAGWAHALSRRPSLLRYIHHPYYLTYITFYRIRLESERQVLGIKRQDETYGSRLSKAHLGNTHTCCVTSHIFTCMLVTDTPFPGRSDSGAEILSLSTAASRSSWLGREGGRPG